MSMNVVNSGDTYQIYGESLKTFKSLPLGTYDVSFNKFVGFFLSEHKDLVVGEEKIYGSTPQKVDKVLKSFRAVNRNFGVILSGRKGIGKSLFARVLANKAKEDNLPLIIVKDYIPGIADFISSIDQEVVVLFDEFEKTFADQEHSNPQEEMLPLFDGIDGGKKLFVVTCNDVHKLNTFLINRPGRFHYHFVLTNPNAEEIREYMNDKLKPEYTEVIKKLVAFSMNVDLTYDVLRAIAFEINNGFSLEETLADLNISKEDSPKYRIIVQYEDGSIRSAENIRINSYSDDNTYVWVKSKNDRGDDMRLEFSPADIVFDGDSGEMYMEPAFIERYIDTDYYNLSDKEDKARFDYLNELKIVRMNFIRNANYSVKYAI